MSHTFGTYRFGNDHNLHLVKCITQLEVAEVRGVARDSLIAM